MEDENSDEEKNSILVIFKMVLKDLKNDDITVNIKGLHDLNNKKMYLHEFPSCLSKIVDSIGFVLQKLCVNPDNVDDLDVNYHFHKKVLKLIESIVEEDRSLASVASNETFIERLVDILIYFCEIVGKIGNYTVSRATIEKFTVIHTCLYTILAILSALLSAPKLFKLSYVALNKTESFGKMLKSLGQILNSDFCYGSQESSLGICCRIVVHSEKLREDCISYFPIKVKRQFESHDAKFIFKNSRSILNRLNISNPYIKSVNIEKFFVEVVNKKSKKKSIEYLSRSIANSTWFDLTAIDLQVEINSQEQVWLPLFKLASVNINKAQTQLRFNCSEVEESFWTYLNDAEKLLEISEITFGVEVRSTDSIKLESIFSILEDTVISINDDRVKDLTMSTEKVSIVSMTDPHTPSSKPEESENGFQLQISKKSKDFEKNVEVGESLQFGGKKSNLKKVENENVDKTKVDKISNAVTGTRRSPRNSPSSDKGIDIVNNPNIPLSKLLTTAPRNKSLTTLKGPSNKLSATNLKLDVFDYNDEANASNEVRITEKPNISQSKERKKENQKAKPKEKPKEMPKEKPNKRAVVNQQEYATRATMRNIIDSPNSENMYDEKIGSKAKMRSPEVTKETPKSKDSNNSTDNESKTIEFTVIKANEFEFEDVDDDIRDRVSDDSEYTETIVETRLKRTRNDKHDKIDHQKVSYEHTYHTFSSSRLTEEEVEKDEDEEVYNFGHMDVIEDENDVSDDKDDIIMPLVRELMSIQEKRQTKKKLRRMEELVSTAIQQVTTYCDNWKNSTLTKSPKVNVDTESVKERVHDYFTRFDCEIADLHREVVELQNIMSGVSKEYKELKNEIKQVKTFVQFETDQLKDELGKRKRLLVEEISKQVTPRKAQKPSVGDFMKKFKSTYA